MAEQPNDPVAIADGRGVSDDELRRVRAQLGDDPELIRELIDIFHQHTPSLMAAIRDAFAREDLAEVARLGHRLKGSTAIFGASAACESAKAIEESSRMGVKEPVAEMLARIDAELAQMEPLFVRLAAG